MSNFEIDSKVHQARVSIILSKLGKELIKRGKTHDFSKFQTPEKDFYKEYHDQLKEATFGSKMYQYYMEKMQPGIQHHYEVNDHHPEHFKDGVVDMDLIQMLEMLADIRAVSIEKGTDVIAFLPKYMKEKNIPENFYTILRNTLQHIIQQEG